MLSLDLFNSKFEQTLQEGSVDTIYEQDAPSEPHPSNLNAFNTPKNIDQVKKIWLAIQQHFLDPDSTYNWLTLKWDNNPDNVTLSVNQVFSILKKLNSMSKQNRQLTLLTKFGDRNSFLTWLSGVKIFPRPMPKKEVPKGQQSLDLKEAEKKSSDNPQFKSARLDRLKTQARAKYPSASSDVEALAADFVDQQDQDQAEFKKVKSTNLRQDELLQQITALNKSQDQEIDGLSNDNSQLQKNIQQLQAANAELAKKLATMSQGRGKPATTTIDVIPGPTPASEPAGPGVTVAPEREPAQSDQNFIQYANRLRQDIKNLELQMALKAPQDQGAMQQEIDDLKAQLAQLQKQPEQLPQPSVAQTTVGGQQADILAGPTPAFVDSQPADEIEFTTINPDIAAMLKSMSDKSKSTGKKTKKKKAVATSELDEGSVFGQQDFDTQMDLAKLKSKLTQPKPAQSAPTSAQEPQPIPARLSDLQSKQEKVVNLTGIKKEIERLQAQATRGGRILPRGLAADLEDYFTVADIDTAYDEMMSKYQKQLAALQQYLGMRKVLWSPKKDVHEMKINELKESGPETWTVHFTDGTTTKVRVPSDETDPAQVRAFFAKKGKTVKKFDYGFGVDQETGSGPEAHEPGSGRAVSARTGETLPEDTMSEFKAAAVAKIKKALNNPKLDPNTRRDYESRLAKIQALEEGRAGYNPLTSKDHWHEVERQLSNLLNNPSLDSESRAEVRQRYLEKRKEAQQKGWAK